MVGFHGCASSRSLGLTLTSAVKRAIRWLFEAHKTPITWWRVVLWWELRRIPYNLLIGIYAVICLLVFYWGITTSGHLQPGEDAVEPMALFIAPFVVNICYTLGWVAELPLRLLEPSLSPRWGPILLILGFGFSMFVISIPAVIWGGYRVLQLAHALK